jgi:hypothetical protein
MSYQSKRQLFKPLVVKHWRIQAHSWFGEIAHVTLQTGVIRRVRVGHIVLIHSGSFFQIEVKWGDNQSKFVSPISLLFLRYLWVENECMSDDDDDNLSLVIPYVKKVILLPKLVIHVKECSREMSQLSTDQSNTLRFCLRETNQFHDFLHRRH